MNLFIYEHITSGALIDEPLPPELAHEGDAMRQAIVEDFADIGTITIIQIRDRRINTPVLPAPHQCIWVNTLEQYQRAFAQALQQADAVLPIAPETQGQLTRIQQQILSQHKRLLGCHPEATRLASDKLACYHHLARHRILSPQTHAARNWMPADEAPAGLIIKPRDGAGCLTTHYFPNSTQYRKWLDAQRSHFIDQLIVQPFIPGIPLSITALFSDTACYLLSVNEQVITINDSSQLVFHGVNINPDSPHLPDSSQLTELIRTLQQALPGLWGLVGIDLIFNDNMLWVIDINPRLTTAYIGLRQSIQYNPAQLLLTMMHTSLDLLPTMPSPIPVEVQV